MAHQTLLDYANKLTNKYAGSHCRIMASRDCQLKIDGFQKLASGLYLEGLTLAPDRTTVWFSDVIGGGIHRVDTDGKKKSYNVDRQWTGGLIVNFDGKLLSTGAGGILWTDPLTEESGWLLDHIGGEPINGINEMAPDGKGGLWFGTVDLSAIARGETPGAASIYHLAADGSLKLAQDGLGFTNGMALSPDGGALYCNESFDGTYVYDVGPHGALSNRRKLLSKPDCDGMAIDATGIVWITGFASDEIVRMAPDGTMSEVYLTPGPAVTQMRFGGTDGRDVYFVTVPRDAGADLAVGNLPTENASFLYRGRADISGHVAPEVRFEIAGGNGR